ncbi:MAG: hypothetical protein J0I07_18850 [Myxococcales bacterium]|nr:hypothetical protein [Myxococcales bacterium]
MTPSELKAAAAELSRVVREYEATGYRVVRSPAVSELPRWLVPFEPDAVAMKGDEGVVFQLRARLNDNREHDIALAQAIANHPGWQLNVLEFFVAPERRADITEHDIRSRLAETRKIIASGSKEGALLLAWSGVEPVLRQLARSEGLQVEPPSPLRLVKELFIHGVIARADYEKLELLVNLRNAVAHGVATGATVLESHAEDLLRFADHTLRRLHEAHGERPTAGSDFTVEQLVEWFRAHYEDPANGVPYESAEGGYIYFAGGPYDAFDELSSAFPDVAKERICTAVAFLENESVEWVRKGDYG